MSFVWRRPGALPSFARGVGGGGSGSSSSGSTAAAAGSVSRRRLLHTEHNSSVLRPLCCSCSGRRPSTPASRPLLTPNVRLAALGTSAPRRSSSHAWMGAAASTMPALSPSIESNALLAATVRAMHVLAPLSLADSSWDNVGLLVEAPEPRRNAQNVSVAIDLTTQVVDEILSSDVGVAVVYHPIIFRGLKSLTMGDSQQRSLLRLIHAGVSVYCPHTSLDAAAGGMNDWLASFATASPKIENAELDAAPWKGIQPITPSKAKEPGHESAGMGRIVELHTPQTVDEVAARLKAVLGNTGSKPLGNVVQIARAEKHAGASPAPISTVAVCAGSGGSVFRGAKADLYVTGELSHHELLAFTQNGSSVVLLNHSNTERPFLPVLAVRLETLLQSAGSPSSVYISLADRDPLEAA